MLASKKGHAEAMKSLLLAKATTNMQDEVSRTKLRLTIEFFTAGTVPHLRREVPPSCWRLQAIRQLWLSF
jgi:hypothetical protein